MYLKFAPTSLKHLSYYVEFGWYLQKHEDRYVVSTPIALNWPNIVPIISSQPEFKEQTLELEKGKHEGEKNQILE